MGLFKKLRNEFIDIIEWVDNTKETIVWKFPRYQNEIKYGAQLTVREGQAAVFMNEGVVADVFTAGRYELETSNLPIMSTILGWKYGFNSPFKADVFFVSLRQFTNQKWGTKNPIMLRDAEFGPIRLRAFGSYSFQIKDPKIFLKEIASTNPTYTVEDINEQLRNIAVSRAMDAIAESNVPILDLASKYDEVSAFIQEKISPEFTEIGLTLAKFLIENISLPSEVEQALDKRSSMGIIGNLGAYAQFQAANSMEKAAENPNGGGIMGAGVGMGLGAGMAGQMSNVFHQNNFDGNNPANQQPTGPPPSIPNEIKYYVAVEGVQTGPFDFNQLKTQANSGSLNKSSLIWKTGLETWKTAEEVEEIRSLFNNTPPPIPS